MCVCVSLSTRKPLVIVWFSAERKTSPSLLLGRSDNLWPRKTSVHLLTIPLSFSVSGRDSWGRRKSRQSDHSWRLPLQENQQRFQKLGQVRLLSVRPGVKIDQIVLSKLCGVSMFLSLSLHAMLAHCFTPQTNKRRRKQAKMEYFGQFWCPLQMWTVGQ